MRFIKTNRMLISVSSLVVMCSLVLGVLSFPAYAKAPNNNAEKAPTQKQLRKLALEQAKKDWPGLSGRALKNHLAVLARTPLYKDPELAAYVQRLGEKMLAVSKHAGRTYRFLLLDDPTPNAFTQGQDYIYVNRGLLMLLQSEAQLAGVLAHEIGHNIGRHVSRSKNKNLRGNIIANTASILTGNSGVGNAIGMQNAVNLRSFGREMELEADQYAAEYLYKANYEPQEMLYALSGLADFGAIANKGESGGGYHGLFASHPRTDKRLRGIIDAAGELPPGEADIGREEYREAIENMVYGRNQRPNAPPGYVRYNNQKLGITFLHPDDWVRSIKGSKIILKDPNDALQFKVEIEKTVDAKAGTEKALKLKYPKELVGVQKIHPAASRDLGVIAKHKKTQRVGLSRAARNTFHFQGISRDNTLLKDVDAVFIGMIASFRRLHPLDKTLTELTRIYYERLLPGETLESIALNKTDENIASIIELRVINGYYPKGQPEPGTWVKKLKKVKIEQGSDDADSVSKAPSP